MESLNVVPIRIKITSILRKAIYSGEYKSGQELSLTDIAAQLGVSRTPVREAFQALENDGLITLRMNKGAIVNNIDAKFINDHYEMRILLESKAVLLASQNKMDVTNLLEKLYDIEKRITKVSKQEYEEINQEIHFSIWQASDNKKLISFLQDLWNGPSVKDDSKEAKKHYELSTKEHIQILEAIKEHKHKKASEIMADHIARSRDNILSLIAKD